MTKFGPAGELTGAARLAGGRAGVVRVRGEDAGAGGRPHQRDAPDAVRGLRGGESPRRNQHLTIETVNRSQKPGTRSIHAPLA